MIFKKKKPIITNAHNFPPPPPQPQIVRAEPANHKDRSVFMYSIVALLIAMASSGSFFAAWMIKPDQTTVLYQPQTLGASDIPPSSMITPPPQPDDSGERKIVTIQSGVNDGYVTSRNQVVDKSDIKIGRDAREVSRGFVSFDLSDMPPKSEISSAKLRLFETKNMGVPLRNGSLLVDHLTYGETLDSTDYSVASILSNIASLTKDSRTKWHEADVTFAIKEDVINNRPRSQFRIHYEIELTKEGAHDAIYFESRDNQSRSGRPPQLEIEYY